MAWFSPAPLILPDIIALNARFLDRKPAFIDGSRTTSWAEFGAGTARVANALKGAGLKKGDRVVVLMSNSYEMAEAMFGIIRAGMVTVPLNVSITDEAIAGMVENSCARAIVASDEHMTRVQALRGKVEAAFEGRFIGLNATLAGWQDYAAFRDAASPDAPSVSIGPADECNIIYSSGTTGLPKGIVHDHACREAWASDMAVALRYHSGARTLCNLGLFSNISWVCMLSTLFAGGAIIVQRHFSAEACLELIQRERVTHAGMVPLQYQRLIECPTFAAYDLSSLDAYMCCGSPLSIEMKTAIIDRMPGEFIELYGLTEGLVTILAPEDMRANPGSVGLPCPGQNIAIIDDNDQPLATGQAGEIVGHSRFMMAGYHDNAAEDEAATWLHPSGQRWLRTGDIGKLDEHGFLYLVDRKKDMIISGGQNIYPADIEAVMHSHEAISEIAVVGVPSKRWGETPLAVVVPVPGNTVSPDELTAWVNGRLGKQQRIAGTVFTDELPRNPNGKILKRSLRQQFASQEF